MPQYNWSCPKCGKMTSTFSRMSEHDTPPEKCAPDSVRTEEVDAEGKPVYQKFEPCGHSGPDGWKKLIGAVNFVINGYSFRNGYSSKW